MPENDSRLVPGRNCGDVPASPGYKGGQVFPNSHIGIASAVAAGDFEGFGMFLMQAVEACMRHPAEKVDPT